MYSIRKAVIGSSYPLTVNGRHFALRKNNFGKNNLLEINSDFEILWLSPEESVNSFISLGNKILYSVYRAKTISRPISDLESIIYECEIPIALNPKNVYLNKFHIGNTKKIGFIQFDLINGKIIEVINNERVPYFHLFQENNIINYHRDQAIIWLQSRVQGDIIWESSLSENIGYKDFQGYHKGEIDATYIFKNQIIVLAKVYVIGLDISNGSILWQTKLDFKHYHLAINGHTG